MIPLAFVSWWYGTGWRSLVKQVSIRVRRTLAAFSVPTLSRTLFAPWKRIISVPGAGIDAKLRAIGDNIVSRAVGFSVRLLVLGAALLTVTGVTVLGCLQIILWPFVPLAIIGCVVKALVG